MRTIINCIFERWKKNTDIYEALVKIVNNIGYDRIYKNLDLNNTKDTNSTGTKVKGGTNIEDIYEDDTLNFGINYSVGIII